MLLLMGSLFPLAVVRRSVLLCFSTIGRDYLRGRGPTSITGVLLYLPRHRRGSSDVAGGRVPVGEDAQVALDGVRALQKRAGSLAGSRRDELHARRQVVLDLHSRSEGRTLVSPW